MAGACGSCTMCCKLMGIKAIDKPKNKTCSNCIAGVGCSIYSDRPQECKSFRCIWLQTQELGPARRMTEAMRPDKSKIILHTTPDEKGIVAKVDPGFPMAWQESDVTAVLSVLSMSLLVLIEAGNRYWLIDKQNAREVIMSEPDENGIETFVRYADEHV